ncbi:POT family-domain-containing protein [Stachybotrys elegans]|uniref:POT family-domain-containing protein n=1 Tax=Stachybotrys elegans TaxID=80388 RepID=A0A8K0SUB4_9HYPO|nr:POT family-domain-containing protein [Stachybotrys elegans]
MASLEKSQVVSAHGREVGEDAASSPEKAKQETTISALERASSSSKRTALAVDRLPRIVWIVAVAGAAERFAYYSLSAPLQNYMQNPRTGSVNPGALGLGQQTATNLSNFFMLLQFVAPMPFAVLSDMRLGRLQTLMLSMCIYQAGNLVLLITSLPFALDRGAGLPGLVVAMLLIAIGVAGLKATLPPFLVDQYNRKDQRTLEETEDEIVVADRTLTIQFITNLFFWLVNLASLSALASTWIEREVDFWASYLIAVVFLFLTQILIFVYRRSFINPAVQGSVLPLALKALWCATRQGFSLEKASPRYQQQHHGKQVPWSEETLRDVKRALVISRILVCSCPFYLGYVQIFHNLISQAGQMRLGGIPNDTMQVFNPAACIVLGPIVQRGLFPLLRKMGIPFRPIARISLACIFMGMAMAYAAIVQNLIYTHGPCYEYPLACEAARLQDGDTAGNDITVWAQLPAWFLMAVAEIFGFATISEIAYEMAPVSMKSLVQAVTQLTAGLAAIVGIALSPLTRDPNLVILYGVIGGLTALAAGLFWIFFRHMDSSRSEEEEETRGVIESAEESSSR